MKNDAGDNYVWRNTKWNFLGKNYIWKLDFSTSILLILVNESKIGKLVTFEFQKNITETCCITIRLRNKLLFLQNLWNFVTLTFSQFHFVPTNIHMMAIQIQFLCKYKPSESQWSRKVFSDVFWLSQMSCQEV